MPRSITQRVIVVLAMLGLASFWKGASTWLGDTLPIDDNAAFAVTFVAIVLGASLLVKLVRERL